MKTVMRMGMAIIPWSGSGFGRRPEGMSFGLGRSVGMVTRSGRSKRHLFTIAFVPNARRAYKLASS